MRPLSPGTVCWLVNLPNEQEIWNGRVITVVRLHHDVWYDIYATWLRDFGWSTPIAHREVLKPMHDPDDLPLRLVAELTEEH